MKKCLFTMLMICGLCVNCLAQEKIIISPADLPKPTQMAEVAPEPMTWLRWSTPNFVIHSIDMEQGRYLDKNIEKMKSWCLSRWGIPEFRFKTEVKIFCTADALAMQKLFGISSSYAEVSEVNGDIKSAHMWLVLDAKPAELIPNALTIVCLKEFSRQFAVNLGWYHFRGMPILNATIPQIKSRIAKLKNPKFDSQRLVFMTEAEWRKLTPEEKTIFDTQAAVLCLMIHKEFGENKFHALMKDSSKILQLLNCEDHAKLDSLLDRYAENLIRDVNGADSKKLNKYLQITKKNNTGFFAR